MTTLVFDKDHNRKLLNQKFVHIANYPVTGNLNGLVNAEILVECSDKAAGFKPFKARISDVSKYILSDIPTVFPWCSHGMGKIEFSKFWCNENKIERAETAVVVVYYLERC